ncbi:XRE family transcriptional regulator [Arthrobacter methylotrophus]|uniref:Cupin domain-containing protein n=1 Tax=Arthrobacter methylotrophus TaxID=121291 RepID=A0ABV5UMA7_9MICC
MVTTYIPKAEVPTVATTAESKERSATEASRLAVGTRIRSARTERGTSLRELARRLGVSAGHISQVERGMVAPSISLLYSIASELSLSMDTLFGEDRTGPGEYEGIEKSPGEERFITRSAERRKIDLDTGVRWELLTPTPHEVVDFREIVYAPGGGSSKPGEFIRHSGREYGLVLEGVLHVQLEFEDFMLGPGDSIAFDSRVPHRLWNENDKTSARAVWCTYSEPVDS